jgi:hypothetical protein
MRAKIIKGVFTLFKFKLFIFLLLMNSLISPSFPQNKAVTYMDYEIIIEFDDDVTSLLNREEALYKDEKDKKIKFKFSVLGDIIPMFNLDTNPTPLINLNAAVENQSDTPAAKVKLTAYTPDKEIDCWLTIENERISKGLEIILPKT